MAASRRQRGIGCAALVLALGCSSGTDRPGSALSGGAPQTGGGHGSSGDVPDDDDDASTSDGDAADSGDASDGMHDGGSTADPATSGAAGDTTAAGGDATTADGGGESSGGDGPSDDGGQGSGETGAVDPCAAPPQPAACDQLDGLAVYCVAPGGSLMVPGAVSYDVGFPEGLPALGVGAPGLGYILESTPITCEPLGCDHATGLGNSPLAPGKICEVAFDHDVAGPTIGTGVYTITVGDDAPAGDYAMGYVTNVGAVALDPDFWIRVGP